MDNKVESFYREIFEDLKVDRTENEQLREYFKTLNPPPDKLVGLRAAAFKVGCQFLTEETESNTSLLKCINEIVDALEHSCMEPANPQGNSDLDEEALMEHLSSIFSDLNVNQDEDQELDAYFERNIPPVGSLSTMRSTFFKVARDHLSEDQQNNVKLLRCINVVVHNFETACLRPKTYQLNMEVPSNILVDSVGLNASISKAAQHLWDLDANRLRPQVDYVINVQNGKKPFRKEDDATDPLFTKVDNNVLKRPTYKAFTEIVDSYNPDTGVAEVIDSSERQEIQAFLKAIQQTAPMQFCHKYCHANKPNIVPKDTEGFLDLLYRIWFELYSRGGGVKDSSGFEHVFVGEIKHGQISGFHNWILFYQEERKGTLDYRGYIKPRSKSEEEAEDDDRILTIQFAWKDVTKAVGSMFIGVSPEFEMALYTMCFLVGDEENAVEIDTGSGVFDLRIKCFKIAHDKVGSSFPEVVTHYED